MYHDSAGRCYWARPDAYSFHWNWHSACDQSGLVYQAFGHWQGGEVLEKWNRDSFRLVGAIFTGGAGYVLYALLQDYLGK